MCKKHGHLNEGDLCKGNDFEHLSATALTVRAFKCFTNVCTFSITIKISRSSLKFSIPVHQIPPEQNYKKHSSIIYFAGIYISQYSK